MCWIGMLYKWTPFKKETNTMKDLLISIAFKVEADNFTSLFPQYAYVQKQDQCAERHLMPTSIYWSFHQAKASDTFIHVEID